MGLIVPDAIEGYLAALNRGSAQGAIALRSPAGAVAA